MADNNKYTIIINGILEKDLTKKLQTQLDTVKDLSVKITKFNITNTAISNLKKNIEAGLKDVNVGIVATSNSSTTTTTRSPLDESGSILLEQAREARRFSERTPESVTYYYDKNAILRQLSSTYDNLNNKIVKHNFLVDEEGNLINKSIVAQDNGIKRYKEQVKLLEQATTARLNLQRAIDASPAKTTSAYQEATGFLGNIDTAIADVDRYISGGAGMTAPLALEQQLKSATQQTNLLKIALGDTGKEWRSMQGMVDKAGKLSSTMTEDMKIRSESVPQVREAIAQSDALGKMYESYNSQLKEGIPLTQEQTEAMNKQYMATDKARAAVGSMGKDTANFSQEMQTAVKRTIEWSIAMSAVYGTINQIKEGIQFINDLDETLTNIQIVSGMTADETRQLANEYNNLAKQLGSTTEAVSQGSLEFIRQGKTVSETTELLRVSTMMSKLGNMDSVQATEIVTSIMNGFNLEAKDMMPVLDKLTQADNMAATSISEIGLALQRTSVSARLAGVSLEEATAMITTISETSRKAPETIGESIKTILARYQSVTLGEEIDEQGEALSNVEKTLNKYGILIRDARGQFRDFGDVLDEINSKWKDLGNTQRSDIATQIAGIRQRENFLILMEKYDRYKEIEMSVTDSAGLAQERYGIYLDSVEAKTNKLKATWEAFWLESFNSKTTKQILDVASAILQVATNMGGLGDVLRIVVGLLLFFNSANIAGIFADIGKSISSTTNAMRGLTIATEGAKVAQTGLQAAMGWVGIALLIGEAVYQVVKYVSWINSAEKAQEDLNAATEKFNQARNDYETELKNEQDLTELLKEYDELSKKINKTEKETARWLEVNQLIHDILPQISGYYDESGQFIVNSALDMATILDLEEQILEVKRKQYEIDKQARIEEQRSLIVKLEEEYQKLLARREEMLSLQEAIDEPQDSVMGIIGQAYLLQGAASAGLLDPDELEEVNVQIEKLGGDLKIARTELALMTGEGLEEVGDKAEDAAEQVETLEGILNHIANSMSGEQRDTFVDFSRQILDLNDAFKNGKINATAYFETLAEKASNADLIGMFKGNTEAAQSFFQALFIEGVEAIATLDSQMQEGKISILEYMDGLQGTGDILREQYESLIENADAYGLNAEQIAEVRTSYEEMTSALSASNQELLNMRDTADLLQAGYDSVMNGTMKPASEEMLNYYQQLSQAAWNYAQQSGFAFKDSAGQALVSAEQIYDYLSGGVGNFSNFASQMTARTNLAVQQQKLAVQQSVKALADIIGSFKMNIVAEQDGFTQISWPLPKIVSGVFGVDSFPIRIPNIKVSGSSSIGNMGAVDTLTNGLTDLIGGGGWNNPGFTDDIWSGGGGYTPPATTGGGGGGGTDSSNEEEEERKEAEQSYQSLLKMTIAMLKDKAKQAKEALQDELKAYKELINQKKKDLDLMKEQRKEQNKIDEAKENITSIEEEIAQLQFDTSEEGIARRLELEEKLAEEKRALEDEQYDQNIENQKRALDEEYENYEDYINEQIDLLDEYLDREGEIVQEAMELIHSGTQEFYDELMEWNMTYGSGVAEDVVDAWQGAIAWINTFAMQGATAVENFANSAGGAVSSMTADISQAAIDAQTAITNATIGMNTAINNTYDRLSGLIGAWGGVTNGLGAFHQYNIPVPYHDGGFAGGMPTLPESEVYAKLLKGEYVATEGDMYNFVHKTLPTLAGSSSDSRSIGDININFDVENLDRDAVPDIKNMVTKAINDTLVDAGFKRNPGSFGAF